MNYFKAVVVLGALVLSLASQSQAQAQDVQIEALNADADSSNRASPATNAAAQQQERERKRRAAGEQRAFVEQQQQEAAQLSASLTADISPDEIAEVKRETAKVLEAVQARPPVAATSKVLATGFAPGTAAPLIELPHGFATAIDIVDEHGDPWIVSGMTVGDRKVVSQPAIGAESDGEPAPTSSVILSPASKFASTNVLIQLENAPRPISLLVRNVDPSGRTIQDRITVMVQSGGRRIKKDAPPIPLGDQATLDPLTRALAGESPMPQAELFALDVSDVVAWRVGNTMFVRSERYELVSPAPTQRAQLDGVIVSQAQYEPVVVLRDRQDRTMLARRLSATSAGNPVSSGRAKGSAQ